jgi:outer membrane protein OmpA-like peptidoglycan-associated protein
VGLFKAELSATPIAASAGAASADTIHRQPAGGPGDADQSEAFSVWMANGLTLAGFASDSAELTEEHRDQITAYKAKLTPLLKTWPDSFISIVGHTDATDTEAHNQDLGQRRADAVLGALGTGDSALPGAIMRASSLGESVLAVESKDREARNRRVEVFFHPRRHFKLPPMTPSQPWAPVPRIDVNPGFGNGLGPGFGPNIGPGPTLPSPFPKIPQTLPERRDWLKDYLSRDALIRKLPEAAQDKVRNALADLDEVAADKVIDLLPLEGEEKEAVKAVAKSILQLLKGKKPNMQEPSPHQLPPSIAPKFDQPPGTKIFPLKEWKF